MSFPKLGFNSNISHSPNWICQFKSLWFWSQLMGTILHKNRDRVLPDYAYNIEDFTDI